MNKDGTMINEVIIILNSFKFAIKRVYIHNLKTL